MIPKNSHILCPNCEELSSWNSHFQKYLCSKCNWSGTLKETNGERKFFHSDTCYKRYLYMKKFTDKINEFIDKGFLVFDDEDELLDKDKKFEYHDGEILLKWSDHLVIGYCGGTRTDDDLIYMLENEYSFKSIKEKFSKFRIVEPKHIIKLKV